MSDKQEQSATEPEQWLKPVKKLEYVQCPTSYGEGIMAGIERSEDYLQKKYGPPSDHIGKEAIDELLAIMDVEREEWKKQLADARAEVEKA